MSTFSLIPHPAHPPLAVRGVGAEVSRGRDRLLLAFRVEGTDRLVWPEPARPGRADALWRATCFELFLRFDDDERYVEFNFSPSTCWAAYAFDGYRDARADLPLAIPPRVDRTDDGVEVVCDPGGLPHGELAMALSAIIEEEGGRRSFWALAHAPGPPNFHAAACFAARLPTGDAA